MKPVYLILAALVLLAVVLYVGYTRCPLCQQKFAAWKRSVALKWVE